MDPNTVTFTADQVQRAMPRLAELYTMSMGELRAMNQQLERSYQGKGLTKVQLVMQIAFNIDAPTTNATKTRADLWHDLQEANQKLHDAKAQADANARAFAEEKRDLNTRLNAQERYASDVRTARDEFQRERNELRGALHQLMGH